MKKNCLKGLICMTLATATISAVSLPTAATVVNTTAEYREIFKEDTRKSASYEELKEKWVELLTGNSLHGKNDKDVINNIRIMDEKIKTYVSEAELEYTENSKYVWRSLVDTQIKNGQETVLPAPTNTAHFKRIKEMAVAYSTKGSSYYNNSDLLDVIKKALSKMHTYHYNTEVKMSGNWWDWIIGTPREIADMLILLDGEIDELKDSLIKTIDRFIPDVPTRVGQSSSFKETGANLLDKAQIVAVRGVAEGNDERIKHAADSIHGVFPYVNNGDGYYKDGSFIQHGNIAYTGSYGAVVLNALSNCLYILQDTEFKIDTKEYYNLFRWLKDSYEPFMSIGGNIMDNVRGRAISRIAQQGNSRGKFIISSMLRIADIAPNEEAENYIKSLTKRWILEGQKADSQYFKGLSAGDVANIKNVQFDENIKISPKRNYYKQFYYMDRAVSNRKNYNFTVSMSSNRIANYEMGNGEGLKSWYTGLGMTQLYTNDINQYNEDFWPTVDPMRLPGVTSDGQTKHKTGVIKVNDQNVNFSSSWAGGTTVDGINGVSGMEILSGMPTAEGVASGLSARKSWFMFENEIVAVGSNISSDSKDVETIVDNRKIKDNGINKFLVNGNEVTKQIGAEDKVKANWAHLEGNVSGSDIGYVFTKETEINTKRESRTHKWNEINEKAEFTDTEDRTKNYLSLAIDHGKAPQGSKYEYIILPNATAEETRSYSENQAVKVLLNTDNVHAVYHEKEKIYAINVWEAGKISDKLTVDAPVSMMIKVQEDGSYKVAVSNPTKNANKVNFIFEDGKLGEFNVSGEGISSTNIISIDTSSKSGETYEFTLTPIKEDKPEDKPEDGEKPNEDGGNVEETPDGNNEENLTNPDGGPVQTGDASAIGLIGLTMASALGAMRLTKKKKNK